MDPLYLATAIPFIGAEHASGIRSNSYRPTCSLATLAPKGARCGS